MEFLDIGKYPVNNYFGYACGGLFCLPGRGIHLLLGVPILGRRKAWEIRLFFGSCMDPSSLDSLPRG
jgi:hypothetical protein